MVSRLLRTIVYVIANPNRSLAWKVVDSLFLVALLILVLLVLLNSSADDLGSYFLLLPVIVLITCRSWYSMPRGRRPTVPPSGGKLPPRLAGPCRPATRLLTPGTRLMTTGLAAPSWSSRDPRQVAEAQAVKR